MAQGGFAAIASNWLLALTQAGASSMAAQRTPPRLQPWIVLSIVASPFLLLLLRCVCFIGFCNGDVGGQPRAIPQEVQFFAPPGLVLWLGYWARPRRREVGMAWTPVYRLVKKIPRG